MVRDPNACIEYSNFVKNDSFLEILVVSDVHVLTVFGRCHTIFTFELFAQVGGRETYFGGNDRYGLVGFVAKKTECLFQSEIVDILWEGEAASKFCQQIVKRMTANVEMVADILAL